MQIKYFQAAWGDIKHSDGWFGKLCLLALVNFVPVFGQIVTFGYLYGWAREIAWGAHEPLPKSLFANEDGKFWRRGWFVLVTTFVFALVPVVVMSIGSSMQSAALFDAAAGRGGAIVGGLGSLIYLVGGVGAVLASMLAWIGCMRVSIYDRLSAGFQIGKVWKMFRRDGVGILKIFGMDLLVGLIAGFVLSIAFSILYGIVMGLGVAGVAASGVSLSSLQGMSDAQLAQLTLQFIGSAGLLFFLVTLLFVFAVEVASAFVSMLVIRALGYWTMQFDVPHWLGQDDPMPFERVDGAAQC